MVVDPVGSLSVAEAALESLFSNLPAFRAWLGVDTPEDAREKIHNDWVPKEAREYPFAIVATDDDGDGLVLRHGSTSAAHDFDQAGLVVVELFQEVPSEYSHHPKDAARAWKNTIGGILDELHTLSGSGDPTGPLAIDELHVVGPKRLNDRDEELTLGKVQWAAFLCAWKS